MGPFCAGTFFDMFAPEGFPKGPLGLNLLPHPYYLEPTNTAKGSNIWKIGVNSFTKGAEQHKYYAKLQ